jgi:hypothetical protein
MRLWQSIFELRERLLVRGIIVALFLLVFSRKSPVKPLGKVAIALPGYMVSCWGLMFN